MADDDKGYGPWSKVPVWDGSPISWRRFKRDVTWWLSSIDLSKTTGYNLAARFLLRQEGIARQRGEEFSPEDLTYVPAATLTDPDTGEEIPDPDSSPDYLAGINRLMKAWEDMNGRTTLDKRGELRQAFYLDLARKPAERVSEFCTRFRSLVADLKGEGVAIGDGELGWWLRQKLGLDPLRRQLLDTALQGSEDYATIEAEILRLFRDLHENDPLYRKLDRRPLTIKRMFLGNAGKAQHGGQSLGSMSSRASTLFSWSRPSSVASRSNAGSTRQANVTEHAEDVIEEQDENEVADEGAGEQPSLEDVLQAEAEVFAAEIQQAEDEGIDHAVLDDFEQGMEQAAEALVTMREARQQLQSVRKDRGYGRNNGKPGDSTFRRSQSNQAEARKASGKHACFDCGEHGHWAGDASCKKPGQGLGRKKSDGGNNTQRKPMRQVRVTEADSGSGSPSTTGVHATDVVEHALPVHDVLVVGNESLVGEVFGSEALNLEQALIQSFSQGVVIPKQQIGLPQDKELVGALDSACNRTCAGPEWLRGYLQALKAAPQAIQDLVLVHEESENFRFGNNGVVPSLQRWRLPALVGKTLILFWVSLVPVNTLGCLVGRDFLEAVGAVLDFARRTLTCAHISSGLLQLQQMVAGHFMLELLPSTSETWRPFTQQSGGRWHRCGQDGVVELYFSRPQWLQYKLFSSKQCNQPDEKEHLLVESSLIASHYSFLRGSSDESATSTSTPTTLARASSPNHRLLSQRRRSHGREADQDSTTSDSEMEPVVLQAGRPSSMARSWNLVVALAAAWHSVFALSLSQCQELWGLEATDRVHEGAEGLAGFALYQSHTEGASIPLGRVPLPSRQAWFRDGLPGGPDGWEHFDGAQHEGSEGGHPKGSDEAHQSRGPAGGEIQGEGGSDSCFGGSPWWSSILEARLGEAGYFAAPAGGGEGHGGEVEAEDSWSTRCSDGHNAQSRQPVSSFPRWSCHDIFVAACDACDVSGKPRFRKPRHQEDSRGGRQVDDSYLEARRQVSPHVPAVDDTPVERSSTIYDGGGSKFTGFKYGVEHGSRGHGAGGDEQGGGAASEHRTSTGASSREDGGSAWRALSTRLGRPYMIGGGQQQSSSSSTVADESPGVLSGKMKSGIKQMISQAWDKHCRDRIAVSKNRFEIYEVLEAQYYKELQDQNEVFTLEVAFPSPFVTEVYTDTEPVAQEARRRGLRAGASMTLATQWDFQLEDHRRAAKLVLKQQKPYLLVLAFPCGPWSMLMFLNSNVDVMQIRARALVLVDYAVELAWMQLRAHRHFMLENPLTSAAWRVNSVAELCRDARVRSVVVDQCQFGLKNVDGDFHRKATQVVTSSQALVSRLLGRRCKGDHKHAPVIGGSKVTRLAGHYPKAFAATIVSALQEQFDYETRLQQRQRGEAANYEVLAVEENPTSALPVNSDGGSSDEMVPAVEEDSKRWWLVSPGVRQAVYRLHENTGHRAPLRLARALMACGAPQEAILAAKQLKCSVCDERKAPRPQRPATLPQTSVVGEKVHIDLVLLEDAFRQTYYAVHATDSVSRFQSAALMKDKSSSSVIQFLMTLWIPLMGRPITLVADQGREFISNEFEQWCASQTIHLYHIGVQCPWQNGFAERSGGTLKAITGAIVRAQSVAGFQELSMALGEATAAYNSDINEEGFSPLQVVTGRQSPPVGDVLAGVQQRLPEHHLVEEEPLLAKQLAAREVARVAMVRLHFSRGLRRAELARSRTSTIRDAPQPGDLCYFWRETKYNPKRQRGSYPTRRKLQLRRWHGPAMLVALEGQSNCFLSHRGQLTKCGLEHVRKASTLEQISSGAWEAAIKEVIESVPLPEVPEGQVLVEAEEEDEELRDLFGEDLPSAPVAPLSTSEVVAAIQPAVVPTAPESSVVGGGSTRNPSKMSSLVLDDVPLQLRQAPAEVQGPTGEVSGGAAAVSGVPSGEARGRVPFQGAVERARSLSRGAEGRGEKRTASQPPELESERGRPLGPVEDPTESTTTRSNFEALVLDWSQLCELASTSADVHPLLQLQARAEMDRRDPVECLETDHGSWDGRWSFLCERDWEVQKSSVPTSTLWQRIFRGLECPSKS